MRGFYVLVAATSLLPACNNAKYEPGPAITVEQHYKHRLGLRGEAEVPEVKWWTRFGDAKLNSLIEEALKANLSIEIARERVRAAGFSAKIVKGNYLPSLNAGSAATVSGQRIWDRDSSTRHVENSSNASKTLAGSWTLDAAAKPTAEAQAALVEAQKEELNAVRLDVIAGMASAYLSAKGLSRQIMIARKSLSVQDNTADITKSRVSAGTASTLDSSRAIAAAALTSADIPSLQRQYDQSINQIAILLGKQPSELSKEMSSYTNAKQPRADISEGVPADLLNNRPDVRQAAWLLKAAVAQVGVAEAALYPSLTFSGVLSFQVANHAKVASWDFGPSINIPLFEGGRLKGQVDLSKSDAKQQYLLYRQTVLIAVRDVEDAMVALKTERARHSRLSYAIKNLREAEASARQLNDAGTTSFSDVLDAQASLYSAQLQLAQSALLIDLDYIALCQALGGGWLDGDTISAESVAAN